MDFMCGDAFTWIVSQKNNGTDTEQKTLLGLLGEFWLRNQINKVFCLRRLIQ